MLQTPAGTVHVCIEPVRPVEVLENVTELEPIGGQFGISTVCEAVVEHPLESVTVSVTETVSGFAQVTEGFCEVLLLGLPLGKVHA
jgi:hypothetical protein